MEKGEQKTCSEADIEKERVITRLAVARLLGKNRPANEQAEVDALDNIFELSSSDWEIIIELRDNFA